MKTADILGVDTVRFIEPEFAAQTDTDIQYNACSRGRHEGTIPAG